MNIKLLLLVNFSDHCGNTRTSVVLPQIHEAMGLSGSKSSQLYLKLVSNEPVDEKVLHDLQALISESNKGRNLASSSGSEIAPKDLILSLTYTCKLKVEASNQKGIRSIVSTASENNKLKGVSGTMKVRVSVTDYES